MADLQPPRANADTQPYWDAAAQERLAYQACGACGRAQFYPRARCAACGAAGLEWRTSSGRGRVASFTSVRRPPSEAFAADVPYVVALVDWEEGFRTMCNIRGGQEAALQIGTPVRAIFEPIGDGGARLPQAVPEQGAEST